jgi:hypothetical protein
MVKRLIVGLLLGTVIGAVLAAVLVQGLGMWSFAVSGVVFAYLAAAATGAVTGLVAGKPIWSEGGKIEAGLKAFFGTLLALGAMFALRQWVSVNVDLTTLKAGAGSIGDLPAASLPLIAAVLAGFFELDNSGEKKKDEEGSDKAADKKADKKVRVAEDEASEDDSEKVEEAEEEPVSAKKKRR